MRITLRTSTAMKGLALLCVMASHAYYPLGGGNTNVYHMTYCLCRAGMFFFVFLSGYGLFSSYNKNGLTNYWEKKVNKIYFPAVLAQCIGTVIYAILTWEVPDRTTLFDDIFVRTFQSDFNPYIGYLQYILIWYILFYAIYKIIHHCAGRILVWSIVSLFMWLFTGEIFSGLSNEYCLAFPLGVAWALITNKQINYLKISNNGNKRKLLIVAVVSVLIIVSCFIVNYNMRPMKNIFFGKSINFWFYTGITNVLYLAICVSMSLIFSIVFRFLKKQGPLEKFGNISFYVYLLHGACIITPLKIVEGYKLIIFLVGIFVMSWLIYLYLIFKKIYLKQE